MLFLPEAPVSFGDGVAQVAYVQPGRNARGIGVSNGMLVRVR